MKRNLNIKVTGRDGTVFYLSKDKPMLYADIIVQSLDMYADPGSRVSKREMGKLADKIDANKKPPKETDLTPGDVELITAALDKGPYVAIAVNQIVKYIEAK